MKNYDRLIFISTSDTATGPMAEAILQSKYLLEELEILSKGLIVLFPEPINPKAATILEARGFHMESHVSDPLVKEDFDERTLFISLSETVKQKVIKAFEPKHPELIRVLNQYVGADWEITNPYGGTLEDYNQCYEELEVLISKLVIQLNEEELLC